MPLSIRGAIADNMLYETKDIVIEKIKDLDDLSKRYNNELSSALSDIGNVTVADVVAPQRLNAPVISEPTTNLNDFPTFKVDALNIPALPSMKDIDAILGNLDLPNLGAMPSAPAELSISTPQVPSIDAIYLPVRPIINTTANFPLAPTINNVVMPTKNISSVAINIPQAPTLGTVSAPTRPNINLSVNMPNAPVLATFSAPAKPSIDTAVTLPTMLPIDSINAPSRPNIDTSITIPDMPVMVMPQLDTLAQIDIPDFVMPNLSLPDAPTMASLKPMTYDPNWWNAPADYQDDIYDKLVLVAKDMLHNPQNFGLPDAVVTALFNKPRERISAEVERTVQEAVSTWAARGFSMPNGMLAKQVNVARQEGQLRVADLNRDIFTEASKYQIDALKFAVEKGMALEQATYNRYLDTVNRLFEVAKYNVEAAFRVYEYQFTLFNAQNEGFKILVDVYKTKLEGFISTMRLQLESAQAKGQLNQLKLEYYQTKLAGVTADVEIFKTKMQAVQMRTDVIKTRFDAYRTDMQAYAEQLSAERIKLEVYDTQMKGAQVKVGIADTQAKIYATEIQAYSGLLDAERLKLETYKSQIDSEQAKLGVAEIQARIYGTDISAYTAELGSEKLKVDIHEAMLRGEQTKASIMQTEASIYETEVRAANAQTETEKLKLDTFESQIRAEQAKLAVADTQAKIYATEIDAYKAQTDAQRIKFDAFDSQVKAEVSKAQIYDSTVKAYASRLQAYVNKGDLDVKQSQIRMDAARAYISKYLADMDGFKAELQANLGQVQYNTQVFGAQVDGWRSKVSAGVADSEMKARYADMNVRTNIAYAEMQIGEYNSKVQQSMAQAQFALEAAKAAGQYTSQLASGAMSAAHVSASISGSGSASVSSSDSESESTSHNYSY